MGLLICISKEFERIIGHRKTNRKNVMQMKPVVDVNVYLILSLFFHNLKLVDFSNGITYFKQQYCYPKLE